MLEPVTIPVGELGRHKITRFEVPESSPEAMRLSFQGRGIKPGTYTKLSRGGTLVMTDTPAEMRDHSRAVHAATGSVLIGGLGIGMVLQAIAKKPNVSHVTVFEREQEVVDLVWPHYKAMFGNKISVEVCDVMERKPNKGERYDFAWWDIWDNICGDNTEDFKKIRRMWSRRIAEQGFWCEYECKRANRESKRWRY